MAVGVDDGLRPDGGGRPRPTVAAHCEFVHRRGVDVATAQHFDRGHRAPAVGLRGVAAQVPQRRQRRRQRPRPLHGPDAVQVHRQRQIGWEGVAGQDCRLPSERRQSERVFHLVAANQNQDKSGVVWCGEVCDVLRVAGNGETRHDTTRHDATRAATRHAPHGTGTMLPGPRHTSTPKRATRHETRRPLAPRTPAATCAMRTDCTARDAETWCPRGNTAVR